MKNLFLSSLFIVAISATAEAQNCTATANGNNINVNAGQVICVTSSISNANVDIAAGGTLKIESGQTLSIQNFNNFNGTLINNGTLVLGNVNFGNGGTLINNNRTTFNGTPNFNGSGTITNNQNGALTFNASFSLGNGSTLTNSGTMISESGDVTVNNGTSLVNSGRLEIKTGNFNPAGLFVNNGFFKVNTFININGGTIRNNCRFIAANGFNNAATFINDGLVWVTNENTGKIQNNAGSFSNTYNGKVRVREFDNNATVSGSGEYYVSGISRQQGTFAGSSAHADSAIRFFDASLNAPQVNGSYFDFGIQGANVQRPASMNAPDTNSFYGFCGQQTFAGGIIPLPLDLLSFTAQAAGNDVRLVWETAKEKNTRLFGVEYSNDGLSWKENGTVAAQGNETFNRYGYTHANVDASLNLYRLRMEDNDGTITYSPIRSVTFANNAAVDVKVFPNPFNDVIHVAFGSRNTTQGVTINITDVTGKQVYQGALETGMGGGRETIALSGLPAGFYLITIKNTADNSVLLHKKLIRN